MDQSSYCYINYGGGGILLVQLTQLTQFIKIIKSGVRVKSQKCKIY